MYLVVHEDREGRERSVPRTFYTKGSALCYIDNKLPEKLPVGDAVVLYECRNTGVVREGCVANARVD